MRCLVGYGPMYVASGENVAYGGGFIYGYCGALIAYLKAFLSAGAQLNSETIQAGAAFEQTWIRMCIGAVNAAANGKCGCTVV